MIPPSPHGLIGAGLRLTRAEIALLVASGIARLLWVFLSPALLTSDAAYYDRAGWQIATGVGYQMDGRPTAYWPVGYPAFLALIYLGAGHSPLAAMLVQVLLGAATTLVTARLVSWAHGARAGITAGVLLALSPNDSSYPALLASETLFTLLFLLGVYVLSGAERPRAYATAGVLLGLAALVRPIAVLLPVWLGVIAVWNHRWSLTRLARPALSYGVVFMMLLVTVSPWTVRNWTALGTPVLVSTNGGINLLIGNNPNATGGYQPLTNPIVRSVWHDEVQRDRAATREAVRFIVDHPLRFVELVGRRAVLLFARGWDGVYGHLRETSVPISMTTRLALYGIAEIYYAAVLIACAVAFFDRRTWTQGGRFLGWVVLYWIAVHLVVMAEPRYRFPIMPLLIGFAGLAMSRWLPDAWWAWSGAPAQRSPHTEPSPSGKGI